MRTYNQAVAYAVAQSRNPTTEIRRGGMCQWFARQCVGASPFGYSAYQAWLSIPASHRHTGAPPPGSLAYWRGGSSGFGHAVFVVEKHLVWSTDIVTHGQVDKVPYTDINRFWGQQYLGYIDWTPSGSLPILSSVRQKPVCHVSRVQPGKQNAEVLIVQKALRNEPDVGLNFSSGPGVFGERTQAAYKRWQRKLGFSTADADGKPGITSLSQLAKRHGFLAAP